MITHICKSDGPCGICYRELYIGEQIANFNLAKSLAQAHDARDLQASWADGYKRHIDKQAEAFAHLAGLMEGLLMRARQKMRTYVSVYPDDKELRFLLAEWDRILLRLRYPLPPHPENTCKDTEPCPQHPRSVPVKSYVCDSPATDHSQGPCPRCEASR